MRNLAATLLAAFVAFGAWAETETVCLERGTLEDIRATVAHYTMPFMIAEAQQIRSLDPVTLAFAACLGNVKEETFRCYTSKR